MPFFSVTLYAIYRQHNVGQSNVKSETSVKMPQDKKRITIPVAPEIEQIRSKISGDLGMKITYTQAFNFLIHFYIERSNEPKTKWRSML